MLPSGITHVCVFFRTHFAKSECQQVDEELQKTYCPSMHESSCSTGLVVNGSTSTKTASKQKRYQSHTESVISNGFQERRQITWIHVAELTARPENASPADAEINE